MSERKKPGSQEGEGEGQDGPGGPGGSGGTGAGGSGGPGSHPPHIIIGVFNDPHDPEWANAQVSVGDFTLIYARILAQVSRDMPECWAAWYLNMMELGQQIALKALGPQTRIMPPVNLKSLNLPCVNCQHMASAHSPTNTTPSAIKCTICGCTNLYVSADKLKELDKQPKPPKGAPGGHHGH